MGIENIVKVAMPIMAAAGMYALLAHAKTECVPLTQAQIKNIFAGNDPYILSNGVEEGVPFKVNSYQLPNRKVAIVYLEKQGHVLPFSHSIQHPDGTVCSYVEHRENEQKERVSEPFRIPQWAVEKWKKDQFS